MDFTELKDLDFNQRSRHPWERARMRIIIRMLKSIVKKAGKTNPVVFDIGCGDGWLSGHITSSFPGCEIHAVDPAFTAEIVQKIKKLKGDAGLSLYDKIENIALPSEKKADIILLLDVIEHVEDDAGFLTTLIDNKHVSKETTFIITTPAFQWLFSSHDKFLKHYRRYSRKSLTSTLNKSRLSPLKSGYFFFVLLFPRIIRLYLEKLKLVKPADKGIGQWKHGSLVTWFIVAFLRIDGFLGSIFLSMGITLPGLSVYSICKPTP